MGMKLKGNYLNFMTFCQKGGKKTKINGAKIVIVDNQHENSL